MSSPSIKIVGEPKPPLLINSSVLLLNKSLVFWITIFFSNSSLLISIETANSDKTFISEISIPFDQYFSKHN